MGVPGVPVSSSGSCKIVTIVKKTKNKFFFFFFFLFFSFFNLDIRSTVISFCKKSLPQTVVFPADPPIDPSGGDHVDSFVSNLNNTDVQDVLSCRSKHVLC